MGKPKSVFTNRNIIHDNRESKKNAAIERRFGNGAKPAQPTVTKANTTRYDNTKSTILPLGDGIHTIGSPTKRWNRVYSNQIRLDDDVGISFTVTAGITYDAGDDAGSSNVHKFDIDSATVMQLQSDKIDIRQDLVNTAGTNNDIGTTSTPFANIYIDNTLFLDTDDDTSINSTSDDTMVLKTGGTARLTIKNDTIEATNPLIFTSVDPLTGSQHGIAFDSNGTNINAATGNLITLSINGTGRLSMSNTSWGGQSGDNFQLFCVSDGTEAPINLEPVAGDPSNVSNGDIWYNSTTGKFRIHEGGSSKNMV